MPKIEKLKKDTAIRVKIEIPKGSNVKYEFNKEKGVMEVDRVTKMRYPHNYGYVLDTMWDDGDPLDVFIIDCQEPLVPGCELEVYPMALVDMEDQMENDAKLIASIEKNHKPLSKVVVGVMDFLQRYKSGTTVFGTSGVEGALTALERAYKLAKDE